VSCSSALFLLGAEFGFLFRGEVDVWEVLLHPLVHGLQLGAAEEVLVAGVGEQTQHPVLAAEASQVGGGRPVPLELPFGGVAARAGLAEQSLALRHRVAPQQVGRSFRRNAGPGQLDGLVARVFRLLEVELKIAGLLEAFLRFLRKVLDPLLLFGRQVGLVLVEVPLRDALDLFGRQDVLAVLLDGQVREPTRAAEQADDGHDAEHVRERVPAALAAPLAERQQRQEEQQQPDGPRNDHRPDEEQVGLEELEQLEQEEEVPLGAGGVVGRAGVGGGVEVGTEAIAAGVGPAARRSPGRPPGPASRSCDRDPASPGR
jgi:hypothetical protein